MCLLEILNGDGSFSEEDRDATKQILKNSFAFPNFPL